MKWTKKIATCAALTALVGCSGDNRTSSEPPPTPMATTNKDLAAPPPPLPMPNVTPSTEKPAQVVTNLDATQQK